MKKNLVHLAVGLFFILNLTSINAQSIRFNPYNGRIITCEGTNSSAYFRFDWSSSSTPYPPKYSVAAFAKLTTHNGVYYNNIYGTNKGSGIPENFTLSSGTYTWTLELYEHFLGEQIFTLTASQTNTFYINYKMYAANNFGGGDIYLEGSLVASGSPVYKIVGESISVGAIDQSDGTYYRIWNASGTNNSNWLKNDSPIYGATSRNYSYTVLSGDNGATLVADLKKIVNVTFQNNFVGAGNGGTIQVNGTTYNSPTSQFQVVEQNAISGSAQWHHINGIDYSFSQWNDGNTSYARTFYPSSTTTYTANFRGKPTTAGRSLYFNTNAGEPVTLYWTDNPNTNVTQYQVWRKVKQNGVVGPEQLIAAVNRAVQTYIDYDYAITTTYSHDLLQYDVRGYYQAEQTYSDPNFAAVYGRQNAKMNEEAAQQIETKEIPTEYSLTNYPNPFNPTTTINYQLPQAGFVTIKVYDMLGREVATLVNENQSAGYYKAGFDASRLTSGVYIYTISVNNYSQSKKMLLAK